MSLLVDTINLMVILKFGNSVLGLTYERKKKNENCQDKSGCLPSSYKYQHYMK